MTTLTIRLPETLKAELDAISLEGTRAVSELVRESLRRYVAVEKFRSLRRKIMPSAAKQGLLTDEDVFRELR